MLTEIDHVAIAVHDLEAARGTTQAESTANTGISTDRRIMTPLDAGLRRLLSSDR